MAATCVQTTLAVATAWCRQLGSGSHVCADDVGSHGDVVYAPRFEAGRNHHRCHNLGHHDATETADTHQAHYDLSAASLPLTTSYWS